MLLRLVLLVWGELQDALLAVRYTDIDYSVFSDAARAVAAGGSPARPPRVHPVHPCALGSGKTFVHNAVPTEARGAD